MVFLRYYVPEIPCLSEQNPPTIEFSTAIWWNLHIADIDRSDKMIGRVVPADKEVDIIIIGAGVVGLTLAHALEQVCFTLIASAFAIT